MLHYHRFWDFFNVKYRFFGTVLGIFGVAFVKALHHTQTQIVLFASGLCVIDC